MTEKPENIAAFPTPSVYGTDGCGIECGQVGMTLRDWFAGQALAGMNASLSNANDWPEDNSRKQMAWNAYRQADAMLAEREKESGA